MSKSHAESQLPPSVDSADAAGLRDAIARAVDYRGDVTIELKDGRQVVGFAFDLSQAAERCPAVRVLHADSDRRESIPLDAIALVRFSGKDAASGKTWENWLRRYAQKKLAGEPASIESDED